MLESYCGAMKGKKMDNMTEKVYMKRTDYVEWRRKKAIIMVKAER
jgi:hypothetical protein